MPASPSSWFFHASRSPQSNVAPAETLPPESPASSDTESSGPALLPALDSRAQQCFQLPPNPAADRDAPHQKCKKMKSPASPAASTPEDTLRNQIPSRDSRFRAASRLAAPSPSLQSQ